jgi:hypothetical protein
MTVFAVATLLYSCPPPVTETVDTDTDSDTDSDTDTFDPGGTLTVADQTLTHAAVVTVGLADYGLAHFVTVLSNDGGSVGALRGHVLNNIGTTTNFEVEIDPPAADGESLWVVMHADTNGNSVFESDIDTVVQVAGSDLATSITVTVPAGTPDLTLTLTEFGGGLFVDAVKPTLLTSQVRPNAQANPALHLPAGRRVAFVNPTSRVLEFVSSGGSPELDVVALAQGATVGPLEGDATLGWTDDDAGTVTFLTDPLFFANVDAVRDANAPTTHRATISQL